MKRDIRIGRILGIALFVSGVVFYLLLSTAHPLLHNHHADGKHHQNCPSCNFVAVASFATVPYTLVVVAFILFVAYLLYRRLQQPYRKLFDKSYFVRGPPPILSPQ
ncbi:MAG: hypothetical protein KJ647_02170 [Candidatus Omnitrophica bacterium]|nr:hypothetical protein [Candidatus Omnitrophota bacterium]MCG2708628.1 hypothetical protein [Candidatus Omnitrophota bacterium]